MKVTVLFFGIIAEVAGTKRVEISGTANTDALQNELLNRYPDISKYKYLISVNQEIAKTNTVLNEDDEVAFLPPFAGG